MSAKEFRAKIAGWKSLTKEKIEAIARQTCMEMGERVVRATPVDTGFLRGSWQPSLGVEADAGEGSLDPDGSLAVAKVSVVANGVIPGDHFTMLNNAKYARFVEYGTSKMAGRFYVQGTVKMWPSVVKQVVQELSAKK